MDRTRMRTALRLLAWGPASLLVQWLAARVAPVSVSLVRCRPMSGPLMRPFAAGPV